MNQIICNSPHSMSLCVCVFISCRRHSQSPRNKNTLKETKKSLSNDVGIALVRLCRVRQIAHNFRMKFNCAFTRQNSSPKFCALVLVHAPNVPFLLLRLHLSRTWAACEDDYKNRQTPNDLFISMSSNEWKSTLIFRLFVAASLSVCVCCDGDIFRQRKQLFDAHRTQNLIHFDLIGSKESQAAK